MWSDWSKVEMDWRVRKLTERGYRLKGWRERVVEGGKKKKK